MRAIPLLLKAYSEQLFKEATDELDDLLVINSAIVKVLRHGSKSRHRLGTPKPNSVTTESKQFGMKLDCIETQIQIISKNHIPDIQFTANNIIIRMVMTITYLGCYLNRDCDNFREIKSRIEKAI